MPFISISIDICGSTAAKAKLRGHSAFIGTAAVELYESFQKQVLLVEETFWTMLRSSGLDIERLFLIKSIGDEVWYAYDLEGLEPYGRRGAVARMIEALVSLQSKSFHLVAGPDGDPGDWENEDITFLLPIDLPLKTTIDVIGETLEVGSVREKYLAPLVPSLLSPLGAVPQTVRTGDERYINLRNRLGIASQVKTADKVYSVVRSDYIGWEVDRFFRITKAAIECAVLIGPGIIADFDEQNLFGINIETPQSTQGIWVISDARIKVCNGPSGFTTLGNNYLLARRFMSNEEQKGIGVGCPIRAVYNKFHQNVKF